MISYYPNLRELSLGAAKYVCRLSQASVKERGIFTLVLSGGKTPQLLYNLLAELPFREIIPWEKTHLFWGDERFVPSDHPDSNFATAFDAFISRIPIPPGNIHRVTVEKSTAEDAALAYERIIRKFFETSGKAKFQNPTEGKPPPSFDLVLLGVGRDGHTASLFPGDNALEERKRWVMHVQTEDIAPAVPRITLTFPVINQSRCVVFLVSGVGKRKVIRTILDDPVNAAALYPAARVQPAGPLIWYIDKESLQRRKR
ncbi:MAG: 6-phosphogluconolactonase [Thermodesulfobacteriota bacterium]